MLPVAAKPTRNTVETMLAYIVHNPQVRDAAIAHLRPEHFDDPDYRGYATVWFVLWGHYKSSGCFPNKTVLECDTIGRLQSDPSVVAAVVADIHDFIEWLYGPENTPEALANTNHGLMLLRIFLSDQLRRTGIRILADNVAVEANVQLPTIVKQMSEQAAVISTIGISPPSDVIPEEWVCETREPFRTGVPFIDEYMDTYPGDVNVILGPTGGGKTMLALQLLVSTASRLYAGNPDNCGWCAYFGYEDERYAPAIRIMANAAKIQSKRLRAIKSFSELSTADNLQPYEKEFVTKTGIVQGEQERLAQARKWVNKCIRVFDFSGRPDENGVAHGYGGLDEIRATIDRTVHALNRPLSLLVIDWAGMVVRRSLQRTGRALDRCLTVELECFVDHVYQITSRHNCVAFVVHQLRGQANRLSPVAAVSHADAAWCSNFAVNAWNVICLGNKDHESGAFTLSWTKCRRNKTKQNLVCYIDGDFCRILDDKRFYLDYASRQIVAEQEIVRGARRETADL